MRRALPYIWITAAFLVTALAVNAVVKAGVSAVSPAAASQTRAWFSDAVVVNRGVEAGTVLHVTVRFGEHATLTWVATNRGTALAHGTITNTPSGMVELQVPTTGAAAQSWVRITFESVRTPLSAWVT